MRTMCRSMLAVAVAGLLVSPALGQVAIQPGGGFFGSPLVMVNDKGVREELKITEEQAGKFKPLQDKVADAQKELKGGFSKEAFQKYQEVSAAVRKELGEILTPEQNKRLGQLELQQKGVSGLFDPKVAKELELTQEQTKEVLQAMQGQFAKAKDLFKDLKGNFQEMQKKMAEMQKAALEDAVKVLTPAQQGKWKDMIGAPYKGTLPGGFGGFGGGGAIQIQPVPPVQIQPIQIQPIQIQPIQRR